MAQDREQDRTGAGAGCKQPEAPLLCANNCGFLGCPTTMNFCSKCFGDLHLKEESQLSVKGLAERKPIMLSAFADKTPSKGAVSTHPTIKDDLQGDLGSVPSNLFVQSRAELMASKAVASSAVASLASGADVSESAELIEGDCKMKQGAKAATLTRLAPVVAPPVQSSGSTRCVSCRKRVGLLGFRCRCGGVFCSGHRYSDLHGCSFDYKAAGRDAIAKANPVVKAEKVDKI